MTQHHIAVSLWAPQTPSRLPTCTFVLTQVSHVFCLHHDRKPICFHSESALSCIYMLRAMIANSLTTSERISLQFVGVTILLRENCRAAESIHTNFGLDDTAPHCSVFLVANHKFLADCQSALFPFTEVLHVLCLYRDQKQNVFTRNRICAAAGPGLCKCDWV